MLAGLSFMEDLEKQEKYTHTHTNLYTQKNHI